MRHYGASDGLDMDKLNSALAKLLRLARTSLNKDKRRSESMLATALSLFQLHFAFGKTSLTLCVNFTSRERKPQLHCFARLRERFCHGAHKISKGRTTPKFGGGDEGRTYKASAVSFQAAFALGRNQGGALSSLR